MGFISALNDAVKGRSSTEECSMSEPVLALVDVLKKMREWVDEIPPQQQSLRYGNPAYRCKTRKTADNKSRESCCRHARLNTTQPRPAHSACDALSTYAGLSR